MKNLPNKILFIFISIITISLSIIFIFNKKEKYSEIENRYLSDFSINNIEEYIRDYFPFKIELISLKNKLEVLSGKTLINDIYIANDDYLIPRFITNEKKDAIINTINNFNKKISNVDVMIVPDSILVNEEKLDYHLDIQEDKEIDYLYSKMNTNNINIINTLKKENKKNNNLYYKSDHHWTTYGAYIAYQEYFKIKGKESYKMNDFTIKKVSDNFEGTSSSLALGLSKKDDIYIFERPTQLEVNYVYENKITNSLYNFDYLNKKNKYEMFLDNNHALIEIENKLIQDDSNILIIKNSYANAFIPFLVNHYNKTYVIDLRYYPKNVSDYINEHDIKNTLILYNLNNMYSDMSIVKLK